MDRHRAEANQRLQEHRRWAASAPRTARPFGIKAVAWIQLVKAGVLLLTAALLRLRPQMAGGQNSPVYPLLFVATRGRYDSMSAALRGGDALAGLFLLLGLYVAAIGVGLFHASAWARRTLIFSCGLTLVLFAKSSLWPDSGASAAPDMTNIYLLLAVDAYVFLYLLRGSTAEYFAAHG
jgi:hypothetical protein